MASLTFNQLKTRFNTWLRDGTNITFTDTEKIELLKTAINDDPYVYIIDRDDSTVIVANQASYPIPSQITEVTDILVDYQSDGYPRRLDRSAFDTINGFIYFTRFYKTIPSGKTMVILGKRKLTDSDLIPSFLQSYILHLSMINAYEMIKASLTTRFVKNDVNMSDLIASLREHEAKASSLRRSIINQHLVVI